MRRVPLVAALVSLAVAVGGCSGFEEPPVPGGSTATPEARDGGDGGGRPARTLAGDSGPPPWVTRPPVTRPSAPGATAPPRQVPSPGGWPRPGTIGPGWSYRTATGESTASRSQALERRVPAALALRASVPRGCARPVPDGRVRAGRVAYLASGEWVDVTRIATGSPRQAEVLAEARRLSLEACRQRAAPSGGPAGPGAEVLVRRVVDLGGGALLSDRTPRSDAYVDVAVLDGPTLVLVTRRTEQWPTSRTARALAAVFSGGRAPGGLR